MTTDPRDPAFPAHVQGSGLTKREYIATAIMAQIASELYEVATEHQGYSAGHLATQAVKAADALIAAIDKTNP